MSRAVRYNVELIQIADIIRGQTRSNDLAGRIDQHSIAVIATNTDEAGARILLERILQRCRNDGILGHTLGSITERHPRPVSCPCTRHPE